MTDRSRSAVETASALRAILSGALKPSVSDTVATVRKGAPSRAAFGAVVALISLIVMPPVAALGWLAVMLVWEAGVRNWIEDRFALPAAARSQQAGFAWLAAINFIGGLGYTSFPVLAWSTGEPVGQVLAAAWICGCATHLFVYFSSNRLLLLVTAGPLLLVAMVAPFLTGGWSLVSAAGSATLVTLVAAAGLFGHDRNVLLSILAKQAVARMEAEQANAAKSQFLATMSHELRTPLNSVIGYAELIEEEADGASAEDARKIRASARQLLGVIDVILDISRLETGVIVVDPDQVQISAVVEQVREAATPLAAVANNSLVVAENEALGEAEIDHARLYQCLMQLIANAAKFTKDGKITLAAARKPVNGRDSLVFTVTDTGIGVPLEHHERIFEPFTQVETNEARRFEGSGLGLALVRRLARLMGGDVTCASAPGQGAVFTLWVASSCADAKAEAA
jgi:signal transduction histidine kinase